MKMNIRILLFIILLNCYNLYSETFPKVQLVDQQFQPIDIQLSSNANELVYYYNMYWLVKPPEGEPIPEEITWMLRSRAGWRPRELTKKHSTEKYREAWEELLPYRISGLLLNATAMYSTIEDYFRQSKSPKSVPALYTAFEMTINSKKYIEFLGKKQKFLLGMFLYIRTDNAFDAFVKSLNLFEASPPPPLSNTNESLYNNNPWSYYKNYLLQANRKPSTEDDIVGLEYTKKWQKLATNYDTSGLLPKTKTFVENLADYRHPYIEYSDDPVFGSNVVEKVIETNAVETAVITNLVVKTVELKPTVETNTNDVEEIVIVDEESNPRSKTLIFLLIIAVIAIIGVLILSKRKSR